MAEKLSVIILATNFTPYIYSLALQAFTLLRSHIPYQSAPPKCQHLLQEQLLRVLLDCKPDQWHALFFKIPRSTEFRTTPKQINAYQSSQAVKLVGVRTLIITAWGTNGLIPWHGFFCTLTWGAGSSTRRKSLVVAKGRLIPCTTWTPGADGNHLSRRSQWLLLLSRLYWWRGNRAHLWRLKMHAH